MTEPIVNARLSAMAQAIPPPPPSFAGSDASVRFDLSGGSPDPGSLPVQAVIAATTQALEADGQWALQYGEGPGYAGLVEQLLAKLRWDNGLDLRPEQVVLTAGASQAVGLLCTALIDPGDTIFAEEPTWSGAVRMFATHRANIIGIPMDENGLRLDVLADELADCRERRVQPKLIYTIPTFQNPTGVTLSLARRHELLRLAQEYGLIVVEDDAYFDLRFEGERLPTLYELAGGSHVAYFGTFSKIVAAGMRIGWLVAEPALIERLSILKVDGGSPFSAYIAHEYCKDGVLEARIQELIDLYRHRRDLMLGELNERMPEGVTWRVPQGGFFIWLDLPEGLDSTRILAACRERGVEFLPGTACFFHGEGRRNIRLSFSYADDEQTVRGMQALCEVISEQLHA